MFTTINLILQWATNTQSVPVDQRNSDSRYIFPAGICEDEHRMHFLFCFLYFAPDVIGATCCDLSDLLARRRAGVSSDRKKKKKKKTRLAREKPAVSDAIAKSGRHPARQRRTSILAASSVGTNAPARTSKQGVGETLRALAYLRESSKHAKGCGSAVPQRNGERKEKNPLTATG